MNWKEQLKENEKGEIFGYKVYKSGFNFIAEKLEGRGKISCSTMQGIILYLSDIEKEIKEQNYVCFCCGYIYDPELGDEKRDINENTPWGDLPEDWDCPLCYAKKIDFEKI